jgi:hypothetical protein
VVINHAKPKTSLTMHLHNMNGFNGLCLLSRQVKRANFFGIELNWQGRTPGPLRAMRSFLGLLSNIKLCCTQPSPLQSREEGTRIGLRGYDYEDMTLRGHDTTRISSSQEVGGSRAERIPALCRDEDEHISITCKTKAGLPPRLAGSYNQNLVPTEYTWKLINLYKPFLQEQP